MPTKKDHAPRQKLSKQKGEKWWQCVSNKNLDITFKYLSMVVDMNRVTILALGMVIYKYNTKKSVVG